MSCYMYSLGNKGKIRGLQDHSSLASQDDLLHLRTAEEQNRK